MSTAQYDLECLELARQLTDKAMKGIRWRLDEHHTEVVQMMNEAANNASAESACSTAQSERENALESALRTLCELKRYKDEHGKTDEYLQQQPEAWKQAMELLGL